MHHAVMHPIAIVPVRENKDGGSLVNALDFGNHIQPPISIVSLSLLGVFQKPDESVLRNVLR